MSSNPTRKENKAASSTAEATPTQQTETITVGSATGVARVGLALKGLGARTGRIGELVKSGADWTLETVTKFGWLIVSLSLLWFPLGLALGWPEFLFLGSVAFLLLLFAIPFQLGRREYRIDFDVADMHMDAGEAKKAPFTVENTNTKLQLPSVMEVTIGEVVEEFPIPILRAGQTAEIPNEIPAQRRGVLNVGPFNIIRTDPVGVLRREKELEKEFELYVYPKYEILPQATTGFLRDLEGANTRIIVESDLDFYSVRKYVPGDNPRHIHWKATAKLGKDDEFMVRQYLETRRSRLIVILAMDKSEYAPMVDDSDEFEVAVSSVASVGLRALMDSRDISIYRGDEIPKIAAKQFGALQRINIHSKKSLMEDLCRVNAIDGATPLRNVCFLAMQLHNDISMAIVVVGSSLTQRQLMEIRSTLPNDIGVVFVQVDHTEKASPKYSQLDNFGIISIQEIEDLGGLLSRYSA